MSGESADLGDFAVLILDKLADTGTYHGSTDESADTAYHMDTVGTGEIVETDLSKPAAAPGPVSLDRVDNGGDHCRINAIG